MAPQQYKLFYQRNLPHFQPVGATLFITFRLAGSLPSEVLQSLRDSLIRQEREVNLIPDPQRRRQFAYSIQKRMFGKWDEKLDQGMDSPRWLANPDIANLVSEAIRRKDGKEYSLDAYCIMPNHIHLVCTPLEFEGEIIPISKIMQSLKGATARQANILLNRRGEFWHHESYDHVVRDSQEYERIIEYVMNNPIRAGLPATWVYRK